MGGNFRFVRQDSRTLHQTQLAATPATIAPCALTKKPLPHKSGVCAKGPLDESRSAGEEHGTILNASSARFRRLSKILGLAAMLAGCEWGWDVDTSGRRQDATTDVDGADVRSETPDVRRPDSGHDARPDMELDAENDADVEDAGIGDAPETDTALDIPHETELDSGVIDTGRDSGADTRDVGTDVPVPPVDAGPWPSWRYCRNINVSGTFPTNYAHQIVFRSPEVDHSHLRPYFEDLRVFEGDCGSIGMGSTPLSIWIENVDSAGGSMVWVKTRTPNVPMLSAIYGNPTATAVSDGAGVFEFFDGFTGMTIDMVRWTTTGRVNALGNEVMLTNSGTDSVIRSNASYGTGKTFEARVLFRGEDPMQSSDAYIGLHNSPTSSYAMCVYNGPATWFPEQVTGGARTSGMMSTIDNAYHVWGVRHDTMNSTYSLDYTPIVRDMSGNNPGGLLYLTMINHGNSVVIMADWVRIRSHLNPDPTNSLGAEMSR